jgi:hypothetical protein
MRRFLVYFKAFAFYLFEDFQKIPEKNSQNSPLVVATGDLYTINRLKPNGDSAYYLL